MKVFVLVTALLVACSAPGASQAQTPASPYTFTCGAYVAAQQGPERGQANAILYWATGYLQARLASLPTTTFSAATFGDDIQDVHGTLTRICPNVPTMVIAEFMSNLAGDFENSAKPQE